MFGSVIEMLVYLAVALLAVKLIFFRNQPDPHRPRKKDEHHVEGCT
jgi:hypothetical protein